MGAIDNIKDVAKLLQALGNVDLIQKMIGVQSDFLELLDKNHRLQEENRDLRERIRVNLKQDELLAKRRHQHNTYWVETDGPYCTGCWDSKDKVVRMATWCNGHAECPVCKYATCFDPVAQRESDDRMAAANRRRAEANW